MKHYHVINTGMEKPYEIDFIVKNEKEAEKLLDQYMMAAAMCRLDVVCVDKRHWIVKSKDKEVTCKMYECEELCSTTVK